MIMYIVWRNAVGNCHHAVLSYGCCSAVPLFLSCDNHFLTEVKILVLVLGRLLSSNLDGKDDRIEHTYLAVSFFLVLLYSARYFSIIFKITLRVTF